MANEIEERMHNLLITSLIEDLGVKNSTCSLNSSYKNFLHCFMVYCNRCFRGDIGHPSVTRNVTQTTTHSPPVGVVSCPDPPRMCEKEGLVTQVQILGLASEFESGQ